ncbi:hypothetical protein J1N35_025199 [Gossypium stocksii]|uniref:Retrovirus-related Pol polyprotein from transposon TNT 1-94-like beta-barrel domain-containing protein n=1 Tax=Gossypium stocksii TaxID=47602 RepID=A0A9D3ZXF6_9ROSI|nr:hypothetical protein J1N35_025199 [Gossypium stocksii]
MTMRFDIEKFNDYTNFDLWAYISEFVSLLNDLKNTEVQIDDEDQAMLLLCSFLSSYKSFRETLIYERNNLSFEEVKGNLLSKEKLDNEFGSNNNSGWKPSALVARNKTGSRSRNQDKVCGYYKKKGHIKTNCYKLQNKNRRVAESNEDEVVNANTTKDKEDDLLLVSTNEMSKFTSRWILDSGCSFHMCPNKNWFSIYITTQCPMVLETPVLKHHFSKLCS